MAYGTNTSSAVVIAVGVVYTVVALLHLAILLCCRRVAERKYVRVNLAVSYGITLMLTSLLVLRVSKGAEPIHLVQLFLPYCFVVLIWWGTIFRTVSRIRGITCNEALVFCTLFVPSVFGFTFFASIQAYKWRIGTYSNTIHDQIVFACSILWPAWLLLSLAIAIYSWTPWARSREAIEEAADDSSIHYEPMDLSSKDLNPYAPPRQRTHRSRMLR